MASVYTTTQDLPFSGPAVSLPMFGRVIALPECNDGIVRITVTVETKVSNCGAILYRSGTSIEVMCRPNGYDITIGFPPTITYTKPKRDDKRVISTESGGHGTTPQPLPDGDIDDPSSGRDEYGRTWTPRTKWVDNPDRVVIIVDQVSPVVSIFNDPEYIKKSFGIDLPAMDDVYTSELAKGFRSVEVLNGLQEVVDFIIHNWTMNTPVTLGPLTGTGITTVTQSQVDTYMAEVLKQVFGDTKVEYAVGADQPDSWSSNTAIAMHDYVAMSYKVIRTDKSLSSTTLVQLVDTIVAAVAAIEDLKVAIERENEMREAVDDYFGSKEAKDAYEQEFGEINYFDPDVR